MEILRIESLDHMINVLAYRIDNSNPEKELSVWRFDRNSSAELTTKLTPCDTRQFYMDFLNKVELICKTTRARRSPFILIKYGDTPMTLLVIEENISSEDSELWKTTLFSFLSSLPIGDALKHFEKFLQNPQELLKIMFFKKE